MAEEHSSGPRSVKIGADERTGWSSDRPRREGEGPRRPPDISTRCRLLKPDAALRYSPGSLLTVVSASREARDAFVARLFTDKSSVLSLDKVKGLIEGRVPASELDERAQQLLAAAAAKRLEAGETVVLAADDLTPEAREPFVRIAAGFRRPRHIMLLETAKDDVSEEDRPALNDLRKRLESGDIGAEGIQTALRLSGATASELKRVVFASPPRDDD
jgi:predicted kinase